MVLLRKPPLLLNPVEKSSNVRLELNAEGERLDSLEDDCLELWRTPLELCGGRDIWLMLMLVASIGDGTLMTGCLGLRGGGGGGCLEELPDTRDVGLDDLAGVEEDT